MSFLWQGSAPSSSSNSTLKQEKSSGNDGRDYKIASSCRRTSPFCVAFDGRVEEGRLMRRRVNGVYVCSGSHQHPYDLQNFRWVRCTLTLNPTLTLFSSRNLKELHATRGHCKTNLVLASVGSLMEYTRAVDLLNRRCVCASLYQRSRCGSVTVMSTVE
jgi:hypothetical protein